MDQTLQKQNRRNAADPNVKNNNGQAPLHEAATYGHKEIAEILLKYKADPNAKNTESLKPLHFAKARGNNDLIKLLEARGAKL